MRKGGRNRRVGGKEVKGGRNRRTGVEGGEVRGVTGGLGWKELKGGEE